MAIEVPFLINPPKKLGKNPWWGEPKRHSKAAKKGWKGRKGKKAKKHRPNPFAEALMIAGANPQRGGKQVAKKKHKKKAYKHNPSKKGHKKRAYKAHSRHNAPKKHHRKHYRKNPAHGRRKKHYRRNPATTSMTGINWTKPMTYLPYVANAAVASIATVAAPRMLGLNTPLKKYGAQAAIAVGGGFLVKSVLGKTHGFVFGITSLAVIAADAINTYVLSHLGVSNVMGIGDGVGAYESSMLGAASHYSLPSEYVSGVDAYERPSFGLADPEYRR